MANSPSSSLPGQSLTAKTLTALEKIAEAIQTRLWDFAKKHNLTPLQVKVLRFLHHHADSGLNTPSSLATEWQLTRPTVSETIRLLVGKGLLKKKRNPADGRAFDLHLTEAGRETAVQSVAYSAPLEHVLDNALAASEAKLFPQLLDVLRQLQRAGFIPRQRMCYNCAYYNTEGSTPSCSFLRIPLPPIDRQVDCPDFQDQP